ncbi:HNH endonuclease [Spirosoma sp. BT702]|uniref:HNH endonuclease n=1 Tax=Spirosoma profusum TaxID=2771354 RepID=A0A927AR64_9BACT|nr:HNH endonuclease [Spirosoma profusum]MBD2701786.1 HNH endonuclease [Spirosoma profusum]
METKGNQSFWNEHWVPILFDNVPNPPHYEVSNYGRLRSFQNVASTQPGSKPSSTLIKGSVIQGYRSLNIRSAGKTLNRYVHKLVAEHFIKRDQPDQLFVIHLDYNKQNNYFQNLRWVTKDEMIEHNRNNPNLKNRQLPRQTRNYKLTESKVKMIKKLLQNDKNRLKMIAKQFGITHTQLNRIRSGENWKHVTIE